VEPDLKDVYFTAIRGIAVRADGSAQGPVPSAREGDPAPLGQFGLREDDSEPIGRFGQREDDAREDDARPVERFHSPDDARPTIHHDPVRETDPPPTDPPHGRREEDA
jgi:hypothetical protein